MFTWRTGASLLAVAALTAAVSGCSGGDDEGAGDGGGRSSGPLQLDEPIKIVAAVEVAGESDAAVNSYDYGMRMAVDKINEAGGIGGQQIEYDRVPLSLSDGSRATSQFLEAVDMEPTAILGLPSSVQHGYLKSQIDRAQLPILSISAAGPDSYLGGPQGSEYLWTVQTYNAAVSHSGIRFLVEELGAERVGLMGTNENYGNSGIAGATAQLEEFGLDPVDVRQHAPDTTDLTSDILAMEGVDAIADWDYPNPLALLVRQLRQNDMDVPVISGESTPIVVDYQMASGPAIENLYGVTPCAPATEATPELAEFHRAYVERFEETPNSLAAEGHDAVYILKAAIERAGSGDPANVNEALDGIRVRDGVVCAPEYHADGAHVLNHTVNVVDYAADGTGTVAKTYEVDEVDAVDP